MTTKPKSASAKPSYETLVEKALELGAMTATLISVDTVVTAPWTRMRCQYGCIGYGNRLSCPPYAPTAAQTQAVLDCYKTGILVEGEFWKVTPLVVAIEREVFIAGYYKAWSMGESMCHQCDSCALDAGCRFPQQLRPSLEASGVDVFQTLLNNDIDQQVAADYDSPIRYWGLVLVE